MPGKQTQEEFISKANLKHNNYYDYSLVNYINANIKVKIICPKHGIYEQQPNNHVWGQRCIWCMGDNVRKARTKSNQIFKDELKFKQPGIYSELIFKEEYKKANIKILFGTKYGDVKLTPRTLLNGESYNIQSAINKTEFFKNILKEKNPIMYESLIFKDEYKGDRIKMLFGTRFGDVKMSPSSLIRGCGFDTRSAVDPHSFFIKYLKFKQPKYFIKNFKFKTKFQGNKTPIVIEYNQDIKTTTPTAMIEGFFSLEGRKGIYCHRIVEDNKLDFIKIPCILYIIKLYNNIESFYKIGITIKDIKTRMKGFPYKKEIIKIKEGNLYDIFKEEQQIHKKLRKYEYKPNTPFGGQTECFTKYK